eukprot:TRINITY_DN8730_c0_g1_i4.p1 TRINITY_DN8730_c0_g1~~TRINITY_DN8730_c0_g1_i4.p1  ORF type:complete len:172 (-),score=27.14 TRINITY_DN8730_c0_g1_i4:98-613(-)
MAGIGFVLRKLSQQDNLIGFVRAYFNSAILATGPWIFTIIAFWAIISSSSTFLPESDMLNFKIIVVYNFSFSAVFCGLVTLVSTRYIADCIFEKNTQPIPGMLIWTIVISLLAQTPMAVWFYFFHSNMNWRLGSVSYTHLTLPTILLVQISVVAVSLKKKNKSGPGTIQPW